MQSFVTISFCADTDADFIFQFNFSHFQFYLFILQFNDNKRFISKLSTKKFREQKIGTQMTKFPSRFFFPSAHYFPCKHNDCLLFGGLIVSEKKGPCGFALAVINQGQMAQQETSQLKHNCHVCLNSLSPRSPQDCVCLNGNNNEADAQLNNECFPFCLMNPRLQKNNKI